MQRRAFCVGVLALISAGVGCGKTEHAPGSVQWVYDLDVARARALALGKPAMVFVGATWDMASKMLEHETFSDPEVRALLQYAFVPVLVDYSDDENPATRRAGDELRIVGTPSIIIVTPSFTELARFHSYIPPRRLATALRVAKAKSDRAKP